MTADEDRHDAREVISKTRADHLENNYILSDLRKDHMCMKRYVFLMCLASKSHKNMLNEKHPNETSQVRATHLLFPSIMSAAVVFKHVKSSLQTY